jgi:hypothetical protein
MKFLPLLLALLLCSCSSGKPQYIPPPKPVEPEPVVQAEGETTELVEEEVVEPVTVDENSFLGILMKEGMPLENIIPRSKEQVAVYQRGDQLRFYYFKRNQLVKQIEVPAENVRLMKAAGNYPSVILEDLGAL